MLTENTYRTYKRKREAPSNFCSVLEVCIWWRILISEFDKSAFFVVLITANVCAYLLKLVDDIVVTAVESAFDAFDSCLTFGGKSCDNKSCACSEVNRSYGSTRKTGSTYDCSGSAFCGDACTHLAEFFEISEASVPNALGDCAYSFCGAQK
jgi:hypothetical protein